MAMNSHKYAIANRNEHPITNGDKYTIADRNEHTVATYTNSDSNTDGNAYARYAIC